VIGLDTNVIVRYLAQDDPIQSPIATKIFERLLTEKNPGFISLVTIAETAWVLERAYSLSGIQIGAVIESLLQTDVLVLESEQQVFAAMTVVKDGRGSFADALIGALGSNAGCSHTLTFDQGAARLPDFTLL
jgi:predicted nucleic-acid-binding protein